MKNLILVVFFSFVAITVLFSCKKPAEAPPGSSVPTITGRWTLVSDTTYDSMPGESNFDSMYIGVASDFYDFEQNGKISMKEGTYSSDAVAYTLSSDNTKMMIQYPADPSTPAPLYFNITTLTNHKLVLTDVPWDTTIGTLNEIIIFSR